MLSQKQRMLNTIRGLPTDRMPWAPRLDLWYRAIRLAGTLPERYRQASLAELVDDLGWSHHAIVPDFMDVRDEAEYADRALGIYSLHVMPYQTRLHELRREVRHEGDITVVSYRTPCGTLRTVTRYDDAMRRAGVTLAHVQEHALKSPEDFAAAEFLFEHAEAVPNDEGFSRYAAGVGERGLTAAFVSLAASPMHLIQRELMPMTDFMYALYDMPERLERLAGSIAGYWERILRVVSASPAELIFWGANYDSMIQYPPLFAEHITPWLCRIADALHGCGKMLVTHTDGENQGLLNEYTRSGIDIADSICPHPMTRLSLGEVREAFRGRITIMGGVPSVALLKNTMSDGEFDRFLDDFFDQLGDGSHQILGVSDTTPPGAEFERLKRIAERVQAFGPIPKRSEGGREDIRH